MRAVAERPPVYNWLAHYQDSDPRRVDATIIADAGIEAALASSPNQTVLRRRASIVMSHGDTWQPMSQRDRDELAADVIAGFAAWLSRQAVSV